jgi:MFS transporter, OPA family, sugar phosphate sensor protein UhpC
VYSAPVMQKSLSLSLVDVGIITSVFPSVYGVAKLFGGVLADVNSPRVVFSGGLVAIAVCNALFAMGGSLPYFAFFWGLNGIVSSIGFPACARMLTSWFSASERGFYWGILNVSLNIGGFLSPILVGSAASTFGWRFGMLCPAAVAAVCGVLCYFAIRDSPAHAGLGPVSQTTRQRTFAHIDAPSNKFRCALETFRSQLIDGVLTVPPVWNLAVAYFFVYIIRQALTSWTIFYFLNAKGVSTLAEAALRVSGLELGGLVGSVSSGWLSDKLIQRDTSAGAVGQRVRVAVIYLVLTACMLIAFYYVPINRALLPFQWAVFAALGAGLYGPQLLIGLSGAECVAPSCAGTSNGFLGTAAYTGAALAGLPLTLVVKNLGWNAFFGVLLLCCAATAAAILPLTRMRSFEQDNPAWRPT